MKKNMDIRYDPEADALYITLKKGKFKETNVIRDDFLIDYDDKGDILGIEILFCSKKFSVNAQDVALKHAV